MSDAPESTGAGSQNDADVIILGVGTCGEDLSMQLLDAGLDVIGIEPRLVGGECPYWACLPSKGMIRAANALEEARRAGDLAGDVDVTPDWSPVAERVRMIVGDWDDSGGVERYEERGGRLVREHGKLTGPRTVSAGGRTFTARHGVVVATGSEPSIPPIPGLEDVDYWTSRDVIQLEELPESLVVLGGGATGCELGQVLARFGVDVTIIEASDRLLPVEEPEASEVLESAFADEGIDVRTGSVAERVSADDGSIVVELEDGAEVQGERLLVATGRTVDLSDLGLESVGLDGDADFIEVDESMRAADGVWAMGDVTGEAMFSHVALYQSAIIAADLLGEDHPSASYHAIPRATFTDPPVGTVGLTEAEARDEGLDATVVVKQIPATFRGVVTGTENGIVKLIVDRESGVLVGATAAGPKAGEMLGLLNLAVHARVPVEELQTMIYAFPTFYGAIGEGVGAYGRGLMAALDPEYEGVDKLDAAVTGAR